MSIPIIFKIATSPMRIYVAGTKRLNDLNRSAMQLAKEKPYTSAEFTKLFGKHKALSSMVDKSVKQMDNIGAYASKLDASKGGSEYSSAVNSVLSRMNNLKSNL